jgi:hypothetical protein
MIKTSRCRLRWLEGASTQDCWEIFRIRFFDQLHQELEPKKGFSTGSSQDYGAHDAVIFPPKDGFIEDYKSLEVDSRRINFFELFHVVAWPKLLW